MTPLPPSGGKKDKFTPEMRILVASLLSMIVFLGWTKYFGPKPPANIPQANKPAASATTTPGTPTTPAPAAASGLTATAAAATTAPATSVPVTADMQERSLVVENALYRVEFSNRGAVVKSWQLKKYKDDCEATAHVGPGASTLGGR